jgi:hypothetical protein
MRVYDAGRASARVEGHNGAQRNRGRAATATFDQRQQPSGTRWVQITLAEFHSIDAIAFLAHWASH